MTHWPALSARAVSVNDGMYVTENYLVLNPGWASAERFLCEVRNPSTVQGYYQPLAMISLMLDSALGGRADHLRPYHRTSVALHVANTVLVIVLVHMLCSPVIGRPLWIAVAVGLLFGVHPMTVETVTWLGERKTVLATFFALCTMVLYVCYVKRAQAVSPSSGDAREASPRGAFRSAVLYFACLAAFVFALMSKPTVTPLPILLILLDVWPLRRISLRSLVEKVPFLVVAAAFAVITVVSQQHVHIVEHRHLDAAQTVLLACHNIVFYLCKMLWPAPLSTVYPFPEPIRLLQPAVLAGVLGTAALLAALMFSLRWTRALLVGWLFFLVALMPTLLNMGYSMGVAADKYAYLPSVGLLLCLAWGLYRLWYGDVGRLSRGRSEGASHAQLPPASAWRRRGRVAVALLLLIVAAAEARATRSYLADWQDTERLCFHILSVAPDTAWAHEQLGYEFLHRGRVDEALRHCRRAVELEPKSATARVNLGLALAQRGSPEGALAEFEAAVQCEPTSAAAHNALGGALAAGGRLGPATTHLREALKLRPDFPQAHFNLALALSGTGKEGFDEAVGHFERAIALRSNNPEAHFKLGELLADHGHVAAAAEHYEKALALWPRQPGLLASLGIELARRGRIDQAILYLRRASHLNPDDAGIHTDLARALVMKGMPDQARAEYRWALRLDPRNAGAIAGLNDLQAAR